MSFAWSKKVNRVLPAQVEVPQAVLLPVISPPVEELVQIVEMPTLDDKISVIEHKNGEQMVESRKEDDEDDEVQGDLQEGGRAEEGDCGGEEELQEARGS